MYTLNCFPSLDTLLPTSSREYHDIDAPSPTLPIPNIPFDVQIVPSLPDPPTHSLAPKSQQPYDPARLTVSAHLRRLRSKSPSTTESPGVHPISPGNCLGRGGYMPTLSRNPTKIAQRTTDGLASNLALGTLIACEICPKAGVQLPGSPPQPEQFN